MTEFIYLAAAKGVANKIINTDNLVIFILTAAIVWFAKDYLERQKKEKQAHLDELKKANEKLKETQDKIASGEKTDITIEARVANIEGSWEEHRTKSDSFMSEFKGLFESFKGKVVKEREDDHTIVQELQKEMQRLIDRRVQPYQSDVKKLSEQVDDLKETLRDADKEISSLRGELKSHMQFTVFITMAASKVEEIDPSVAELVRDILEVPKLQQLKNLHEASREMERASQDSDDS